MFRRNDHRLLLVSALVVLALLLALAPLPAQEKPATLADLAWISGTWVLETERSRTEEHWTAPASNAMLGMSRTLRGDRMVAFEYLRIVQREDGIYYVAQPGGRPATDFKLTRFDGATAVFENPQHDFPKRILYKKNADGSLTARVDAGEGTRGEDFPFKRK